MMNIKLGPVSKDFALTVLGVQKFRDGGGWGKFDNQDVYLCIGAHSDGTSGWTIKQVGRNF